MRVLFQRHKKYNEVIKRTIKRHKTVSKNKYAKGQRRNSEVDEEFAIFSEVSEQSQVYQNPSREDVLDFFQNQRNYKMEARSMILE